MTDSNELQNMRVSYEKFTLDESDAGSDPLLFFQKWFQIAKQENVKEPNAMSLATVSREGHPSVRIVLLKGLEEGKFLFFTNYESLKGKEIANNNKVALAFFWPELERQIRIQGTASKVSRESSEAYFAKRPRVSQLGAFVSNQSEVVANRAELEKKWEDIEKSLEGKPVPTPDTWGGYAVDPTAIEFWQGRQGRLHDRIAFRKSGQTWERFRLSP